MAERSPFLKQSRRRRSAAAGAALILSAFAWWAVFLAAMTASAPALAVPAFAKQTGQPCAACHVGAFGPQLKPYGRDFKLHGYVASDGRIMACNGRSPR